MFYSDGADLLIGHIKECNGSMNTAGYVHWQDRGMWLGYFEEFPDYITQGESLEELQENLRDLYKDLTSGEINGIRRVSQLTLG
jgi:predicted RNase H-like HicB family nuclease